MCVLILLALRYLHPPVPVLKSGVEHDELVSIAETLLSDLPSVKRHEEPKSVYVGGDYHCQTVFRRVTASTTGFKMPK